MKIISLIHSISINKIKFYQTNNFIKTRAWHFCLINSIIFWIIKLFPIKIMLLITSFVFSVWNTFEIIKFLFQTFFSVIFINASVYLLYLTHAKLQIFLFLHLLNFPRQIKRLRCEDKFYCHLFISRLIVLLERSPTFVIMIPRASLIDRFTSAQWRRLMVYPHTANWCCTSGQA